MRLRVAAVVVGLGAVWACKSGDSNASLFVTVTPTSVTGNVPAKVQITATNDDGTVGTGNVQVQSSAGTLSTPITVTLDNAGTASAMLSADPVANMCSTAVDITGTWTPKGGTALTSHATLNVLTPGYDAGMVTDNPLSPIDALCDTDAGLMTVFPDAGPLLPDDVPSDCANGFELNNPSGRGIYSVMAKTSAGSRPLTLDIDLATYKVPDKVRITGVDSCAKPYTLLSSCELQTANVGDPTGGMGRPPDATIRQFRVNMPGGTRELTFDFSNVTSPMYLRVVGLCDFNVATYPNASDWQAVP
jgi:hypothetical protein